jgi:hypothetical protein
MRFDVKDREIEVEKLKLEVDIWKESKQTEMEKAQSIVTPHFTKQLALHEEDNTASRELLK